MKKKGEEKIKKNKIVKFPKPAKKDSTLLGSA